MRTTALRTESGRVVCERCGVADSAWTRLRGLLGRKGLAPDEGILIRPAGSVHTMFMRFPIDVVFLDRDLRVLKVTRALGPWRASGARGAKCVLETAANAADVEPGERLVLDE
jgi:uncharacterized protein